MTHISSLYFTTHVEFVFVFKDKCLRASYDMKYICCLSSVSSWGDTVRLKSTSLIVLYDLSVCTASLSSTGRVCMPVGLLRHMFGCVFVCPYPTPPSVAYPHPSLCRPHPTRMETLTKIPSAENLELGKVFSFQPGAVHAGFACLTCCQESVLVALPGVCL